MIDEKLIKKDIDNKSKHVGTLSVGITWVEGSILFKNDKKWAKAYYAICHYSKRVWLMTPLDWEKATMIATIYVSPSENYCDRAFMCLNFGCPLNRFDKSVFSSQFDAGAYSLGLPQDLGTKPLWFNSGKFISVFESLILSPAGGTLKYSEEKLAQYLKEK